jgi:hypothetical protein
MSGPRSGGTFHDYYLVWTTELYTAQYNGILPPDHDAQAEQVSGPLAHYALALELKGPSDE